jgi:streptogramin lyase
VRSRSLCILVVLAGVLALAAPAGAITPTITEFSAGLTAFSDPTSITVGPDGNLWFVEYPSPGRIGKITTQGTITEVATGGTTPNFTMNPQISGIVPGPDGQLWFTEGHNPGRVGRIDPSNGAVQELVTGGVSPGFRLNSGPEEIGTGTDGSLWFAEVSSPGAIARITTSGVVTEFTSGLSTGAEPNGMTPTPGPDGNLWFSDGGSPNRVGRIDTTSGAISEFSTGLAPAGDVRDITAGPDGNVWFAQFANPGRLGKVAPDGTISEVATGGVTPGFTANRDPEGIATGPDGALWFTEFAQPSGPAQVARFNPADGTVQEFPLPTAVSGPEQIVLGPDGNMWFTEFGNTKIGRITTPPTASTIGASTTARSATITGTANGHAQATSFHVDYGPAGGATTSTPEQPVGITSGDTPVSTALGGLSPGTSYQARIVVANPTGAAAGAFVGFKTASAAPVISGARQSAKRWREGKRLAHFSRKRRPPVGTRFSLRLDQPAHLKLLFQFTRSCRSRSRRKRAKCRGLSTAGALTFRGRAGLNRVSFQGRLSRRKRLKPRAYRLTIRATNAEGQASKPARLRFTIVK